MGGPLVGSCIEGDLHSRDQLVVARVSADPEPDGLTVFHEGHGAVRPARTSRVDRRFRIDALEV